MLRLLSSTQEDESHYYSVTFEVGDMRLVEQCDEEYAVFIEGTIVQALEPDGVDPVQIGRVEAILFRGRDMMNLGVSPFDAFDAINQDTAALYTALYDDDEISWDVHDMFPEYHANVLAIMFVGVEQEHRGKGVGQAALARLVQVFGGDAYVVLQNVPMGYANGERERLPEDEVDTLRPQRQKMWQAMGFLPSPLQPEERGFLIGCGHDLCRPATCDDELEAVA